MNEDDSYELAVYFWVSSSPANTIFADGHDAGYSCAALTIGEWVHIRLDIDVDNATYTANIDGDPGDCVDMSWATTDVGPGNLKTVDFYGGSGGAGVGAMDNLRIYVPE
jgi:hypothetical protein